jgi:hypothetical protein
VTEDEAPLLDDVVEMIAILGDGDLAMGIEHEELNRVREVVKDIGATAGSSIDSRRKSLRAKSKMAVDYATQC